MPYSQIECLVIQYCSLESGSTVSDITDYCAFECPAYADSYVFVCHVAGLTAPGTTPSFDDDVMYEVNIDSDADNVEDQVIQVFFRDGQAIAYGVVTAAQTGLNSEIIAGDTRIAADIAVAVSDVFGDGFYTLH
ncbi:protein of unknown function [Reichenbachiella agariperforans]|uniref:Uncharacterized protein n=2 Tax=Reichenbachiella agariperforans TaxID=156994 RepID=A0A1M6K6P4_REIAG|nr:protein of unknown function [Reichenbachiella agariperforans]